MLEDTSSFTLPSLTANTRRVEEVHVDAGVALITSIFVALSRRIVELVFVSSHDDIFVGEFSEIDLRSGDLYLFY